MKQCKECGANLPEESRYCLQCGKAVDPADEAETKPARPQPPLDFVQPALAGGMFLGFFSALPVISIANMICCLWVVLGGGIAVVMLTRQRPSGITFGDGAFVGVLSGLFGAIVGTALQIPLQIITIRLFGSQQQELEAWFKRFGIDQIPDWILQFASGEVTVVTVLFTFFANLVMWSLFAMIGGILTVAILNKRRPVGTV